MALQPMLAKEDKMCFPTWVDSVSKLATLGIGAISAIYVFLQYRRAQRWKAADLAATLLERLNTDQALLLACQALDWGVGPLIIPDQYRPLFPSDASGESPRVMEHNPTVLCVALKPMLDGATLRDPKGLVYRYCFIKLFSYLDNMFKLLADEQVFGRDIDEVEYWLEKLRDYPYAPGTREGTEVFQPAVRAWGYDNITLLAKRLNLRPWIPRNTA